MSRRTLALAFGARARLSRTSGETDEILWFVWRGYADRVLVGSYGHSRLRERVFGGMTPDIMQRSPICSLMSHRCAPAASSSQCPSRRGPGSRLPSRHPPSLTLIKAVLPAPGMIRLAEPAAEPAMPPDPFALIVAAAFASGCASIHGLRRHADAVTLVLALLAYVLAALVGSMLAARNGMVTVPERLGGWMVVSRSGDLGSASASRFP